MTDPAFRKEVNQVEPGALIIGNQVFVQGLSASGRLFVFNREQIQFLWALQKMKEPTAAALSINRDLAWAERFMGSSKFKAYVAHKMEEFSVKSGLTVEWWYQFGKRLAEGKEETHQGHCPGCNYDWELTAYESESLRNDDMEFEAPCPKCTFKPVSLLVKEREFKPTREMVEGWKELGSRLIPKIERVQHQFTSDEIIFESSEEAR